MSPILSCTARIKTSVNLIAHRRYTFSTAVATFFQSSRPTLSPSPAHPAALSPARLPLRRGRCNGPPRLVQHRRRRMRIRPQAPSFWTNPSQVPTLLFLHRGGVIGCCAHTTRMLNLSKESATRARCELSIAPASHVEEKAKSGSNTTGTSFREDLRP